jgi:hypothetical protein
MGDTQHSYEIKKNGRTGTLGSLFIDDNSSYEHLISVIKDQVQSFPSDSITIVIKPQVKKRLPLW